MYVFFRDSVKPWIYEYIPTTHLGRRYFSKFKSGMTKYIYICHGFIGSLGM